MVGKRTIQAPKSRAEDHCRNQDLESGHRRKRFGGFKDAVEYALDRRTTAALKEQLKNGVDRQEFEKYRKSDEEVGKLIKLTGIHADVLTAAQEDQRQEDTQILREAKCRSERLGRGRYHRVGNG